MSSDEYQVQNEYKYTRKSYKKNGRRTCPASEALCIDNSIEASHCCPREETPHCCPKEETPHCCPREETPHCCPREETTHCCPGVDETTRRCPRTEVNITACSFDDTDVANILHKKCPVITLAQQQLQRLLDETDNILCDNTRCCRSIYDFICICREVLRMRNKCLCFLLALLFVSFLFGVLFGAASCGEKLRKFNSPILTCIDNYFITDSYVHKKEFRGIV